MTTEGWRRGTRELELSSCLHFAPSPPVHGRGGDLPSRKEDAEFLLTFARWVFERDSGITIKALSRLAAERVSRHSRRDAACS